MNVEGRMNLHLDDVDEQRRSFHNVQDCTLSPKAPRKSTNVVAPEIRRHVKLFKQYVSTCKQNGFDCALESGSSSDVSDRGDEISPTSHSSGEYESSKPATTTPSFLSRQKSSCCAGTTEGMISHSFKSPTPDIARLNWRNAKSCSSLRQQIGNEQVASKVKSIQVTDDGSTSGVYKRQLAAALSAGRAVWL